MRNVGTGEPHRANGQTGKRAIGQSGQRPGPKALDGGAPRRYVRKRMSSLAPGLLVAAPPLADPNFDRSVVLLAAHGPEGAFGWVITGREVMTVGELIDRAEVMGM